MSSMNQIGVPTFTQTLTALDKILDKLAAHVEAKKIDESVFVNLRLAPDMFPFSRQIQIMTDACKGAVARLAGRELPSWPDDEKTLAELKARVGKALAYIASVPPAEFEGSDERMVKVKLGRNAPETEMSGKDLLAKVSLPNFYFHAPTAWMSARMTF